MSDGTAWLITGAAGGMGREVASRTPPEATAVVTDISPAKVERLVSELRESGLTAVGLAGDLTDVTFIESLGDVVARSGQLRALVHTAGLWDTTTDAARVFDVNYRSTVQILDRMARLMGEGSVAVCIASIGAHRRGGRSAVGSLYADPDPDSVWRAATGTYGARMTPTIAYSIAKRGVIQECERRTRELGARGARIVSVSPGNFDTSMGRDARATGGASLFADAAIGRRSGRPEDIADLVEFLVSGRAAYISGCDIRIDGGAIPSLREEGRNPAFIAWDSVLDT